MHCIIWEEAMVGNCDLPVYGPISGTRYCIVGGGIVRGRCPAGTLGMTGTLRFCDYRGPRYSDVWRQMCPLQVRLLTVRQWQICSLRGWFLGLYYMELSNATTPTMSDLQCIKPCKVLLNVWLRGGPRFLRSTPSLCSSWDRLLRRVTSDWPSPEMCTHAAIQNYYIGDKTQVPISRSGKYSSDKQCISHISFSHCTHA